MNLIRTQWEGTQPLSTGKSTYLVKRLYSFQPIPAARITPAIGIAAVIAGVISAVTAVEIPEKSRVAAKEGTAEITAETAARPATYSFFIFFGSFCLLSSCRRAATVLPLLRDKHFESQIDSVQAPCD